MSKAEQMPECAAFVRTMRKIFGREVGGYASENGVEVTWGNWREGRYVPVVMKVKSKGAK